MISYKKILVVDDDVEFAEMVREYLQPEGFAVELAHDGPACFRCAPETQDLIVLDVMLPGQSGFEILKELRRRSSVPVLMLTARDTETDRIVGLEIGADDYVPKPVNPRELVARIRAILRRSAAPQTEPATELIAGDVQLNSAARTAWRDGKPLDLTTAEFNLLEYLLRNPGKIVPRDELSAAAFDRHDGSRIDRNVDTLISKLRRKLGPAREFEQRIKTIRNVGYLYALAGEGAQGNNVPEITDVLRTLFSKILVWSAAAQLIILGSILALTMFYVPESEDAVNNAWSLYAHDAVMLYEKMGPDALQEFLSRTGEDTLLRLQLALTRPGAPCTPANIGEVVGESGEGGGGNDATTTIQTMGSDGEYCLTVHVKPGGLPETAESRRTRLQVAILFELLSSAGLSYIIARYLSRPISELRRASAQLAQGDLSARAGGKFSTRKDEAADLVREFDQMAERLSGLIEAQHRLIADISHEIKSPLARLSIALGLARRSAEQYAPRHFDRMQSEVDRISLLSNELLTLERLDSAAGVAMEPVDLGALIADIIADARYESSARAGDFVFARSRTSFLVSCDANLLRRAIENLVRNAIFYTTPGTKIEISLTGKEPERVLIEVRDHGPGVPAASLPHLFEPFYRVDEARGRKTGGTGIGLAICQRVVHLHRGVISAGNGQPSGLIVTIDLPVGALDPAAGRADDDGDYDMAAD